MEYERLRMAVFASGGGTNFQAIIDAVEAGTIPAEIVLCVSNKREAGALARAQKHRIPSLILSPSDYPDEEMYCTKLFSALNDHEVNFIVLAGYMRMIPAKIVRRFRGRMLNIHPALLPAFGGKGMYGKYVHEAVLEYGVKWTGVTVHLVDELYDHGPVVLQEPVPVLENDTPDSLAERVLKTEHKLYSEAVRLFAENRVRLEGRKVIIKN